MGFYKEGHDNMNFPVNLGMIESLSYAREVDDRSAACGIGRRVAEP